MSSRKSARHRIDLRCHLCTRVKILGDSPPVPPTRAPFKPVEFDGLQVTPYVTNKGRMAYSLRATGIKAARQSGKDAA